MAAQKITPVNNSHQGIKIDVHDCVLAFGDAGFPLAFFLAVTHLCHDLLPLNLLRIT